MAGAAWQMTPAGFSWLNVGDLRAAMAAGHRPRALLSVSDSPWAEIGRVAFDATDPGIVTFAGNPADILIDPPDNTTAWALSTRLTGSAPLSLLAYSHNSPTASD